MGEMAEYLIDQALEQEWQTIDQLIKKAKKLPLTELVESLENADLEKILDDNFAEKVLSICQWYREKGWLSDKQKKCLISAWIELDQADSF